MKFTLSALRQYLDTAASLEEITTSLTNIGFEVENILNMYDIYKDFRVAYVKSTSPHPNANNLQLCQVIVSDDSTNQEILEIICGAPNARAGIYVILAPIGSIIPANDMKIKKSSIRGVASNGMLCSAEELSLNTNPFFDSSSIQENNAEGIVELKNVFKIGSSFAKIANLDDVQIEIAVTPNRGDVLSVYGIARELALANIGILKDLDAKTETKYTVKSSNINLDVKSEYVKYFSLIEIANVTNPPSPELLARKLTTIDENSVSSLVDISNITNFTLGQPIHIYDANKAGQNFIVQNSFENQKFISLKDEEYSLEENKHICIEDDCRNILCVAGVMGGLSSSCDENTKNIYVEIGIFDAIQIAHSRRALNISSASSYRFERGIHESLEYIKYVREYVIHSILEICGGTYIGEVEYNLLSNEKDINPIELKYENIEKRIGTNLVEISNVIEILEKLGCYNVTHNRIGQGADSYTEIIATTPPWRHDLKIEEDLIEEIIRILGYDKIIETPLDYQHVSSNSYLDFTNKLRVSLANLGGYEMITWSFDFTNSIFYEKYMDSIEPILLNNPISSELNGMRRSMLPHLLSIISKNLARGVSSMNIFEIGNIFDADGNEHGILTSILYGEAKEKTIHVNSRNYDFYDIKKIALEAITIAGMQADKATIRINSNKKYLHKNISATISFGKNIVGYVGQISYSLAHDLGLPKNIFICEIFLDKLKIKKLHIKEYTENNLPITQRDYNFIFDNSVTFATISQKISSLQIPEIISVQFLEIYRNDDRIGKDKQSIMFRVKIQAQNENITSEDLNKIQNRVIDEITSIGGDIRDS